MPWLQKCLNRSVLNWGTKCLVIIRTHKYVYIYKIIYSIKYIYICMCVSYIYIYIYISIYIYIFIVYHYQHFYVCTSVCLHLSPGSRWKIISNQGAPKPVRNEKSCELYPVSRQYIAKANPIPGSKLAFVICHRPMKYYEILKLTFGPTRAVDMYKSCGFCKTIG